MFKQVELVVDAAAVLGEGPVWDDRDGTLWFTDILGKRLHQVDPRKGSDAVIGLPQEVGALVPRSRGGLLLAVRDGFASLERGRFELLVEVEADNPAHRMNDGKCDRSGRFWASSMAFDCSPGEGTLYCLNADLTVTAVLADLTIGNGLAWTPDDRTLYFIDSSTGAVDAFDAEVAPLANRRAAVKVDPDHGVPDGMCLDDEGFLWVALYGGGAVHRYAPDGSLDRVVALPATNVTCCAFGGADLDELYITTAAAVDEPLSGGLFRHRPGVAGPAPFAFAG